MPAGSSAVSPNNKLLRVLKQAKRVAREYYQLTGRPLGVTGEVAEFEAARLLGVKLEEARTAGYDATELVDGTVRRVQIKGRCIQESSKRSQTLGSITCDHEWDSVLMVLMDEEFEAVEIHEALRPAIVAALTVPGSRARNERGALAVSKFKKIGRLRWRRPA